MTDRADPQLKPGLALIANSHTPYREHLHTRLAREIPEMKVWTLFTHELSGVGLWAFNASPEIGPVSFGPGQPAPTQSHFRYIPREWRKGGKIIQFIKENNVRAVVVLGYNDAGRFRILRWCRGHGIPTFIWGDSNVLGDRVTGFRRWAKRRIVPRLLRLANGVLACGSLGRAFFERYGVSPDRVFLCPNEPDYDLIRKLPQERIDAARTRFGLADTRRRLIYSGRLIRDKRVDLLIQAFASIAPERPNWDLIIVGEGAERASLQACIPASVRDRVQLVGFIADQADVSALYRLSDVLVLPSDYEPWALVLNEAAAAGLAVVCTNVVGAAPELVRVGVNGYTFPPGDLPALIACLDDVTHPERIDGMKAASPVVLDEWSRRDDPVKGVRAALRSVGLLV